MMRKISSLLYREWRMSGKYYIIVLVLLIVCMVLGWLIRLSMDIGNLSFVWEESYDSPETLNSLVYNLLVYGIGAAVSCALISDNSSFSQDIGCGWLRYSYGLPVTPFERALVRTVVKLTAVILSLLLSVINGAIVGVVAGKELTWDTVVYFFIAIDVFLFATTFRHALVCRARDSRAYKLANVIYYIVLLASELSLAAVLTNYMTNYIKGQASAAVSDEQLLSALGDKAGYILDAAAPWLIPVCAALIIAGFLLTACGSKVRER